MAYMNFVCLLVHAFMNGNLQNVVFIYGVPVIVDCSVDNMFCALICNSNTVNSLKISFESCQKN